MAKAKKKQAPKDATMCPCRAWARFYTSEERHKLLRGESIGHHPECDGLGGRNRGGQK